DIEWLSRALEDFSDRPGRAHGTCQSGCENGAIIDRHDVVCARGCEPHLQNVMGSPPRMENCAPPARTVRVNQVCYGRDDAGLCHGFGDKRTFPEMIFGK